MRIHLAGSYTHLAVKFGAENILDSYWYLKNDMKKAKHLNDNSNFILDSGAFTAHTQGIDINIDDYISYIKKLKPALYAGLDVIGNAEKTEKNIIYMEKGGLKPIPTFHRGSDFDYLYKMIDKYDYIAVGGLAGLDTGQTQSRLWLDRIFNQIDMRKPKLKVHGFACSGKNIMALYPWTSVDSTSWLACVRFGRMLNGMSDKKFVDKFLRENPDYSKKEDEFLGEKIECKLTKEKIRDIVLRESVKQFQELERHINETHKTSSFAGIKQVDMFD